jgi:transposase
VQALRRRFRRRVRRARGRRFIVVDETGAKTTFTRRVAWGKRGERVRATAPAGHWNTTTLMAAVGLDGVAAAMAFRGATDGAAFRAFCERVLAPQLRPGDVVVLDNLSSHKDRQAIESLRRAGAEVWFLPPYSPDFSPIENIFSKVKEYLRQAEARDERALVQAIGRALETVTAADCINCFRHCGYRTTNV